MESGRKSNRERETNPDTASVLGIAAQTPIDPAAQRRSSSGTATLSEKSRPSRPEELEAFLDGLTRAQEEQERFEKRMDIERLNEELNLLIMISASARRVDSTRKYTNFVTANLW